jgi:integrase
MPKNLYQRGSVWWARIAIDGRDVRRSLRTTDRAEARRRLKELLSDAGRARVGLGPASSRHPWQDAVVAWGDSARARSLRPATLRRYQASLRMLDPHFRSRDVASLTSADFHAYGLARMRAGVSPATVRRDLSVASLVMQAAKRHGWRSDNPVPDEWAEIPERREPIKPVPVPVMAALFAVEYGELAQVWRFIARTGCRQEEAASLEWWQLDLDRSACTFARTKTRSPRTIALSPATVRDLRCLPRSATSTYVFRSRRGDRYHALPSRWRELVTRALARWERDEAREGRLPSGFRADPPRCHDLRHTFAIRWLQRGGDIYALSRHLGHSTVKTTEIYLGWMRR